LSKTSEFLCPDVRLTTPSSYTNASSPQIKQTEDVLKPEFSLSLLNSSHRKSDKVLPSIQPARAAAY